MKLDSIIQVNSSELTKREWRKLFVKLTFRDTEDIECAAYDYRSQSDTVAIPRGAWDMLPDLEVIDLRSRPPMPKRTFAKRLDTPGYEEQSLAVAAMFEHEQGRVIAPPGRGKALDLLTPLPTPEGWTTMDDVQVGDKLLDETGCECEVTFVTEPYMGTCYRIEFSDRSWVIADADHRWLTWDRDARVYSRSQELGSTKFRSKRFPEVRTTEDILATMYRSDGRLNHSIANCAPLELPEANLPIPPYLLGAWLGDGSSYKAEITTMDEEIIAAFRPFYGVVRRTHQSAGRAVTYGITGGMHSALSELGVYRKKRIPKIYLRASKEQRMALLQGIMDTDGGWASGMAEVSLSNKQLTNDVAELVQSLGMSVRRSWKVPILNGVVCKKSYRLKFSPICQVFSLPRKADKYIEDRGQLHRRTHRYIVKVEPTKSRMVKCIQVSSPSHLFLAGEQMVPTHNTEMCLAFAATCETRVLVVVHTHDLLKQWVERAKTSLPDMPVGVIQGQKCDVQQLTIATAQTLRKYIMSGGKFWRQFGALVLDECFPAGTLVDGKPIETIQVGDFVTSVSGQRCRVTKVYKHRPVCMVRVTTAQQEIVCTAGHPFLTKSGWVAAINLTSDSMVLSSKHEEKGQVSRVSADRQCGFQVGQSSMGLVQAMRQGLLLKGMPTDVPFPRIIGEDGQDKSEVCIRAHETQQPYEARRSTCDCQPTAQRDRAQATNSRWQRARPNSSAKNSLEAIGLADRSDCQHEFRAREGRLPDSLQARHCQCEEDGCDRDRWLVSSSFGSTQARSKEDSVLEWVGVDGVEVLEPGSDGQFGEVCPDGFVYNLEVEGDHTYFADGLAVHNCHHSAAETWEWILNSCPAYYRFGVTASERRSDGRQALVRFYVGPVIYRMKFKAQVPMIVQPVQTSFRCKWNGQQYARVMRELVRDEDRNDSIAALALKEIKAGNTVLVLSRQIVHLNNIRESLDKMSAGTLTDDQVEIVTGQIPKSRRDRFIDNLRDGSLACILGTQLFEEGVDVPRLNRIILAFPGTEITVLQKVGRGTRQAEGKYECVVYDILDPYVRVLAKQYLRRRSWYKSVGITVDKATKGGRNAKA